MNYTATPQAKVFYTVSVDFIYKNQLARCTTLAFSIRYLMVHYIVASEIHNNDQFYFLFMQPSIILYSASIPACKLITYKSLSYNNEII